MILISVLMRFSFIFVFRAKSEAIEQNEGEKEQKGKKSTDNEELQLMSQCSDVVEISSQDSPARRDVRTTMSRREAHIQHNSLNPFSTHFWTSL